MFRAVTVQRRSGVPLVVWNRGIGNFESARFLQFKSEIKNLKMNNPKRALGSSILRFPISGFKLQESCTFKISDSPIPNHQCVGEPSGRKYVGPDAASVIAS